MSRLLTDLLPEATAAVDIGALALDSREVRPGSLPVCTATAAPISPLPPSAEPRPSPTRRRTPPRCRPWTFP